MVSNQANLFLIFTLEGITIGLIFDIFRILRKSFKTSDIVTYIEDILFWLITGILLLYTIFVFNYGEIRFFMFVGIFLGAMLYMLLISRYVIKISVTVIEILKKIITFIFKISIFPFRFIYKILKKIFSKPILFCIINIKKIIRQIKIKILKKSTKNQNICKKSKKIEGKTKQK